MRLGVNIDHIATVRQARRGRTPDPVDAALVCQRAGATSIVCHLREDRRHIQDDDVRRLRQHLSIPLNLEMSMAPDIVRVALAVRPKQVTLVPERRQELTTEGGLDVAKACARVRKVVHTFRQQQIQVSLFVDPKLDQLEAARERVAKVIELHTGRYAEARAARARQQELKAIQQMARQGRALGLTVAAGHGLDYDNVGAVAKIPDIEELNIGFFIISRALAVGLERAVREMLACMQ